MDGELQFKSSSCSSRVSSLSLILLSENLQKLDLQCFQKRAFMRMFKVMAGKRNLALVEYTGNPMQLVSPFFFCTSLLFCNLTTFKQINFMIYSIKVITLNKIIYSRKKSQPCNVWATYGFVQTLSGDVERLIELHFALFFFPVDLNF